MCGIVFLAELFLVPILHGRRRRRRLSAKRDRTRPRDRHWSSRRSVQGDVYQSGRQFHRRDGRRIAEAAFDCPLDLLTHQCGKQHFSEFLMAAALVARSAVPRMR